MNYLKYNLKCGWEGAMEEPRGTHQLLIQKQSLWLAVLFTWCLEMFYLRGLEML